MIEKVLVLNFKISSRYFVGFFIIYFHNLVLILLKIDRIILISYFVSRLINSDIIILKILHLVAIFLKHLVVNF
jgi:hypothetical protein